MLKNERYKIGLLSGILLFLFIPVLQNIFHFKWVKPLKGAYVEAPDVNLSKAWFEGDYQEKKEEYINQNFGLRNYYVRFNNQIDFSLFKKANVDKVVVGKGDFLYEINYIDAYLGNNFIGKKKLEERFKKLKSLQDYLQLQHIHLEVVFAPGKATFYPEYIPKDWATEKKLNNYEYSRDLCKKFNIRFIDFNSWFLSQKSFSPYDLYPKTGIHWSNYGSLIAFDSLTKHVEHYTNSNLKTLTITNVSFSDSLRGPDNDIGEAMNLIWDIQPFPMPYANYHWVEEDFIKPKALFIGDSYFWNIYYEGLTNNVYEDCKFWYYNETVYPESETERKVKDLNLLEQIKKQKVIVLMATECNIHDIGWGFIEQATEAFKKEMKEVLRKNIYMQNIIEEIHFTPKWMADIIKKAKMNNVSVDKQIKMDALYIYNSDYGRPEVIELTEDTKARILNTSPWVEQIKNKAKEKNISFEEMLELDAKYIYVTEQRANMK
jgi:hypothetical protein